MWLEMIGKIIGLATAGGALAGIGVLNRFLSGIAIIIMLAIVSGFMICALLTGGFYIAYLGLIHYGLEPEISGLIVGGLVLLITVLLVTITYMRLDSLREVAYKEKDAPSSPIPNNFDLTNLATAFIDGFLNPRK